MDIAFDDIINVNILKSKYEEFEVAIKARAISVIKDFLAFIRHIRLHLKSSKLLNLINEQEKVAKRILWIYRIRFILFAIYKRLIERMVDKLVILIKAFIALL